MLSGSTTSAVKQQVGHPPCIHAYIFKLDWRTKELMMWLPLKELLCLTLIFLTRL